MAFNALVLYLQVVLVTIVSFTQVNLYAAGSNFGQSYSQAETVETFTWTSTGTFNSGQSIVFDSIEGGAVITLSEDGTTFTFHQCGQYLIPISINNPSNAGTQVDILLLNPDGSFLIIGRAEGTASIVDGFTSTLNISCNFFSEAQIKFVVNAGAGISFNTKNAPGIDLTDHDVDAHI